MFQAIRRMLGGSPSPAPAPEDPAILEARRREFEEYRAAADRVQESGLFECCDFAQGIGIGVRGEDREVKIRVSILEDLTPDRDGLTTLLRKFAAPKPLELEASGIAHTLEGYIGDIYHPRRFSERILEQLCNEKPDHFISIDCNDFLGPFEKSRQAAGHALRNFKQDHWVPVIRLGTTPEVSLTHAFRSDHGAEIEPFIPLKAPGRTSKALAEKLSQILDAPLQGALKSVTSNEEGRIRIELHHDCIPNLVNLGTTLTKLFEPTRFMIAVVGDEFKRDQSIEVKELSPALIAELHRSAHGQFLYICRDECVGPFPTQEDAIKASKQAFPADLWGEVLELKEDGACKIHNNLVAERIARSRDKHESDQEE
ncbi:MAG: hypothetical protein KDD64_13850 [Bdellovibrionales bacterium]|nr:hypothetical protein [Bdellovibrionales bacterium]